MSAADARNTAQERERAAWRSLAFSLLAALPVAIMIGLTTSSFFQQYEGLAVAHRPMPGTSESADVRFFVIEHADQSWSEHPLPVAAFAGAALPLSSRGAPPRKPPEDAVEVRKARFSASVVIGGVPWPTSGPADLLIPLGLLLFVGLGRNLLTTGSAFQVVPGDGPSKPLALQDKPGQVAQSKKKARPKKGPPPGRRGRGKGRRRR